MAKGELNRVHVWLPELTKIHRHRDSVNWRLRPDGLETAGSVAGSAGQLVTVPKVWENFGVPMTSSADEYGVPVELILATACTESRGNPAAIREEPGYVSDERTPHKVSPGIMQTLISTARDTLSDESIDREWLLVPTNSIRAGTSYISKQAKVTHLDPPKVAAAYNAGSVYDNDGPENRWKMRQYPIGTGKHVDRFVEWFNDCFRMFEGGIEAPVQSYYQLLRTDGRR